MPVVLAGLLLCASGAWAQHVHRGPSLTLDERAAAQVTQAYFAAAAANDVHTMCLLGGPAKDFSNAAIDPSDGQLVPGSWSQLCPFMHTKLELTLNADRYEKAAKERPKAANELAGQITLTYSEGLTVELRRGATGAWVPQPTAGIGGAGGLQPVIGALPATATP